MADFKFTDQQMFFQPFGYLSFPGLMADRIDQINAAFEELWTENGGHNSQPHNSVARSCLA